MLGMDLEKGNSLCECPMDSACTNKKERCDCPEYCQQYYDTLDSIGRPVCVTVSPDCREYDSLDKCHEQWRGYFYKMRRHLKYGIFVLEIAQGRRPHYHMMLDVKDKIGLTKTLYSWGKYHNVKKHNMFHNGIHYLFKEVNYTRTNTGIEPIMDYDMFIKEQDEKLTLRSLERLRRKREDAKQLTLTLPKWMRALPEVSPQEDVDTLCHGTANPTVACEDTNVGELSSEE